MAPRIAANSTFFHSLFRLTTKKTLKLWITGLLYWLIPLTRLQLCRKCFHFMISWPLHLGDCPTPPMSVQWCFLAISSVKYCSDQLQTWQLHSLLACLMLVMHLLIETTTKWPQSYRYFHVHFPGWKWMYFDEILIAEVGPKGSVDDKSTLFHIMAWFQIGSRPFPGPLMVHCTYACYSITWPWWHNASVVLFHY